MKRKEVITPTNDISTPLHIPNIPSTTESHHNVPLVKKRRTKNFKLREDMEKSRGTIIMKIDPFEPDTFNTWDEFIQSWTEYMARTKTLYRRRSSCSTAKWNSKNRFKKYPVPERFEYATMAYWCTHGCLQPSRGTGVRAHLHNRFTGCTARITVDVVYEKSNDTDLQWFIRVRNQISQHNHKISDEIYNCYTNNSSVPDDILLGAEPPLHDLDDPATKLMRSFEADEADLSRGISQVESDENVSRQNLSSFSSDEQGNLGNEFGIAAAHSYNGNLFLKEAESDEQKMIFITSTLRPLLKEFKRTPLRDIQKRLQDVSDTVQTLLGKWQRDSIEDETSSHLLGPIAHESDDVSVPTASTFHTDIFTETRDTILNETSKQAAGERKTD